MGEDLENLKKIIRNPLLLQEEQQKLLELVDKNGGTEEVYQQIQAVFEGAVRRQVAKAGFAMQGFDEQVKTAEAEMEREKGLLLRRVEEKLAGIAIDELTERSKIWDEYYGKIFELYRELEDKIRNIAAKILGGQVKSTD